MPKIKNKIIRILLIVGILLFISGGVLVYAYYKESTQYNNWNNNGEFPVIKKPAVYLYPTEKLNITVKVVINGSIINSKPKYNEGWDVMGEPNGIINGTYDYLFYEARLNKLLLPSEGWIVKYENLNNWFKVYLSKLGLNSKEITQFKDYWLKELPKAKYYEIKLLDDTFLKENMDLQIYPKPTTLIRRNLYFKPHNSTITLQEPYIVSPERKGFTVVEWGGLLGK